MLVFTWSFGNLYFFTIGGMLHLWFIYWCIIWCTHFLCIISHNYKCSFMGSRLCMWSAIWKSLILKVEDNEAIWYVYVLKTHLGICYWYISPNPRWGSYGIVQSSHSIPHLWFMPDLLSRAGIMENTNKMQYHIAPHEVQNVIIKTTLYYCWIIFIVLIIQKVAVYILLEKPEKCQLNLIAKCSKFIFTYTNT